MRAPLSPRMVLLAMGLGAWAWPSQGRAQSAAEPDVLVDAPMDDEYPDTDPSALTDFRPALDPYGTWVDDPTYGTAWTPGPDQVGGGFQPYDTGGSWDYVDGDYVWVSDYAWGWVCFHYGRWVLSGGRWVWIPGRQYAGAWVSWRVGEDGFGYVGWAPVAPTWIWLGVTATAIGSTPQEPWAFSTTGDLFSQGVGARVITGAAAVSVAAHTAPYVAARPGVTTRGPLAQPVPHGPPPATLGLDVSHLALPALGARELRARQLARPSTALPLGGHPPARHVVHVMPQPPAMPRWSGGGARAPSHGRR